MQRHLLDHNLYRCIC